MYLAHISDTGVLILASIAAATYITITIVKYMLSSEKKK
jgi:hypothetical protein